MKIIVQRVSRASVEIDGEQTAAIERGFLVLLGVLKGDSEEDVLKLWKKLAGLRIFEDETGKSNLNLEQVGGRLLIVSQFTLAANCRKGNRPSYIEAAAPEDGERLYNSFVYWARQEFPDTQTGRFGADMKVELLNDGPFTIILDSREL